MVRSATAVRRKKIFSPMDGAVLLAMLAETQASCQRIAAKEHVKVTWKRL